MRPFLLVVGMSYFVPLAQALPHPKHKTTSLTAIKGRPKPLPPDQLVGKIVYVLGDEVWAINPQTQHKRLLYTGMNDVSWSLDRKQIAFIHSNPKSLTPEIYAMNWDGSAKRLISKQDYGFRPRWSPDGTKLLYAQSDPVRAMPIQTTGFRIVDLTGKEPDYNSDRKTGSYLNPRWSRDGKQILAEYMDYHDGDEHFPAKVLSLDGKPVEEFKNDWKNFIVDNQSRDGKQRAYKESAFILDDAWWYDEVNNYTSHLVWDWDGGFKILNLRFGAKRGEFAVEGYLPRWTIDTQGLARVENVLGVWLITENPELPQRQLLRLLANDAHLVDWF